MSQDSVTLAGVGDIILDRDEPETIFRHVAHVLRGADVTFAQIEQMYSEKGCPGTPQHTVTYSHPRLIPALVSAGINVAGMAGNHTLDLGAPALMDTMERLHAAGIATVGAGRNIAEAREPAIVERKRTRIAFLSYCTTGPKGYEADEGNAGFAPVRVSTLYEALEYQPGTPCQVITIPHQEDLPAMVADIKKAKKENDVVVLSIHWGWHNVPILVAMYQQAIGRAAIEAGADLILGHHAHILKGIEVYKGKAIFYSLGNFAIEFSPEKKQQSKPTWRILMRKLYNFQPDPTYITYHFHPESKATLIAKAVIADKKVQKVSYIPTYIGPRSEPELVARQDPRGQEVFNYVQHITEKQNLNAVFEWDGDSEVIVRAGADEAEPIGPQLLRFARP